MPQTEFMQRKFERFYIVCKRCVAALGYEEDAPKFATERGIKRHLRDQHNGAEHNERERFRL